MGRAIPFLLAPAAKDYLWGGETLKDEFGKRAKLDCLAETWECSTHPEGQSIVISGANEGLKLGEVLRIHPEYMGTHPQFMGELPILVKLIDAQEDLSVQVHPDDEYARIYEMGQLGKTEMWYVLHAGKDAKIVYGFNRDVSKEEIKKALKLKKIENYLQYVPVNKGDVFLIRAGTVHAIGKDIVIAEVQESSNLTYRLYDYDRKDRYGISRELHINKALDVLETKGPLNPRQPMRVLGYRNGFASELLCRCKYFQVERLLLNTERYRNMADFRTGTNSFHVLLCTDGCGVVFGDGVMINFFKGDCIFIPADSVSLKLHGKAQFLNIGC